LRAVQIRVSALIAASATAAALAVPALGAHAPRTASAVSGGIYLATLTGTQQSVAARSGTVRDEFGCRFALRHADRQVLTFSASRTARLVLRPGGKLPRLAFAAARVAVAGTRHRQSDLTGGDTDVCDAPGPPQTYRCGKRVLSARLTLRPVAEDRVTLDGSLASGAIRLACATTLTKPDRFPLPFESRLAIPADAASGLVAHGRLHALTRADGGVAKTTDVRWTLVLKRVP
jgi:hypothetical protein